MHKANLLPFLLLLACGPKVEAPFEGEGEYEGQYAGGRSPEGWREDRGEERQVARGDRAREEEGRAERGRAARRDQTPSEQERVAQGRSPEGWGPSPHATDGIEEPDTEVAREGSGRVAEGPMARTRPPEVTTPGEGEGLGTNGEAAPGTDGEVARGTNGEAEPVDEVGSRAEFGRALRQLRSDVEAVRASTDPAHAEVVAALRRLQGALSSLPNSAGAAREIDHIGVLADRLEQSDVNSLEHADWTKAALLSGAEALTNVAQANDLGDVMAPQIRALRAQADTIQDGVGLLKQGNEAAGALQEMVNALSAFDERSRPLGTQ